MRKDNKIQLLSKGADTIMYDLLDSRSDELKELTTHHLNVSYALFIYLCLRTGYNEADYAISVHDCLGNCTFKRGQRQRNRYTDRQKERDSWRKLGMC